MEIGEIISDAIKYPADNIKAMLIYIALSIVAALVLVFAIGGAAATADNVLAAGAIGLIGVIIAGAVALFSYGIARIAKIVKSISLTQELTLFNFVKKRQG